MVVVGQSVDRSFTTAVGGVWRVQDLLMGDKRECGFVELSLSAVILRIKKKGVDHLLRCVALGDDFSAALSAPH